MADLDWFPFEPGRWLKNTLHLTARQHGGYLLLTMAAFESRGDLPSTDAGLMTVAKLSPRDWKDDGDTLKAFLTWDGVKWVHEFARHMREDAERRVAGKARAGKAGAAKRWNGRGNGSAIAEAPDSQCQTDAQLQGQLQEQNVTTNLPVERENALTRAAVAKGFEIFNEVASRVGWPQVQRMDDKRRKAMAHRLRECGGIDGFSMALAKAEGSDFLTGKSGKWTGFSIDWLLKPANFTKVMEGNYDRSVDGSRANGSSTTADFAAAADLLRDRVYSGV